MRPPPVSSSLLPLQSAEVHPQIVPVRSLVRRVLNAERRIRIDRPSSPRPAAAGKPHRADEVLGKLAATYRAGDRVGARQVVALCGVSPSLAALIRKWAVAEGRWPYLPALCGFQAYRDRKGRAS